MPRLAIIVILSVFVFYSNIWGVSIYILDESKNATCAKEMYQRSDWVVPTFNGKLRTDKPPLHYYFMMSAYKVFGGATPFSARFFSALMGVLTVLSVFLFTRKYKGEKVAFYSCLVMLSSLMMGVQFHLAVPDPYLIFFMVTGSLLLFDAWYESEFWKLILAYGLLAMAFMAKGPIAVVLPAIGILLFLLGMRNFSWKNIASFQPWTGLVVVLILVVPWYYQVGVATDGKWLEEFFFKHNVDRFTSTMEGHGGFPLSALVIALFALLPFSLFIPQSVIFAWKTRYMDQFVFYCLALGVGVILFFLFSQTILPSYVSPALPFLSVVIGTFLHKIIARFRFRKALNVSLIVGLIIAVAFPIAAYFGIKQDQSINEHTMLFLWLLIIPIGVAVAFYFLMHSQLKQMIYSLAATFIGSFLIIMYVIFPHFDQANPIYNSQQIVKSYGPNVYYYGRMNAGFAFYADQVILKVETGSHLNELLQSDKDFLIITREDQSKILSDNKQLKEVFRQKDLFENHTTILFTNN